MVSSSSPGVEGELIRSAWHLDLIHLAFAQCGHLCTGLEIMLRQRLTLQVVLRRRQVVRCVPSDSDSQPSAREEFP